jgi:hypothetical protein
MSFEQPLDTADADVVPGGKYPLGCAALETGNELLHVSGCQPVIDRQPSWVGVDDRVHPWLVGLVALIDAMEDVDQGF